MSERVRSKDASRKSKRESLPTYALTDSRGQPLNPYLKWSARLSAAAEPELRDILRLYCGTCMHAAEGALAESHKIGRVCAMAELVRRGLAL
jgi:hypothetical protein